MNKADYSKRMDRLTEKRNSKIDDYLHKTSQYIIKYCAKNDINTIVIGKNKSAKSRRKFITFCGFGCIFFSCMLEYRQEKTLLSWRGAA